MVTKPALKTPNKATSARVTFASPPATPVYFLSSSEESSSPDRDAPESSSVAQSSLKRRRAQADIQDDNVREKIAFNHELCSHFHDIYAKAYRSKQCDSVDDVLLQQLIHFVDHRAFQLAYSMQSVPNQSTPKRTKKPKQTPKSHADTARSVPSMPKNVDFDDDRCAADKETEVDEDSTSIRQMPKRNRKLSLFRDDSPPRSSKVQDEIQGTPFDRMLQHEDIIIPRTPRTPSKRRKAGKWEPSSSKATVIDDKNVPQSIAATSQPIDISDDEEETQPVKPVQMTVDERKVVEKEEVPVLLRQLKTARDEISAPLGISPEDILTRRTLQGLVDKVPQDYMMFKSILADTSGIANSEPAERKAYVEGKWSKYGMRFLQICIAYRQEPVGQSSGQTPQMKVTRSISAGAAFKKTVSAHEYDAPDKSFDLRKYRFA